MSLRCLPSSFGPICLMILEGVSFEEFQYGRRGCGQLGYWNGMILVILNLCFTVMHHIKFWLNPLTIREEMLFEELQDDRNGGHFVYWNGTMLANLNLCITVMPTIKFQAESDERFERRHLKNFKIDILDIGTERF